MDLLLCYNTDIVWISTLNIICLLTCRVRETAIKKDSSACQKFWKEPLRGSVSCAQLETFFTLRGTSSKTTFYLLSYFFSATNPKSHCKGSCCGPFEVGLSKRESSQAPPCETDSSVSFCLVRDERVPLLVTAQSFDQAPTTIREESILKWWFLTSFNGLKKIQNAVRLQDTNNIY